MCYNFFIYNIIKLTGQTLISKQRLSSIEKILHKHFRRNKIMDKKIKVLILFGGKSAEHEVSLQSAKNVVDAIDKKKYEIILVGIDKKGHWYLNDASNFLLNAENPKLVKLNKTNDHVALVQRDRNEQLMNISRNQSLGRVDVAFPVLHGPFGEDGTIQGLLKLADIPFVGVDVLGSAVGMDKDIAKRLFRDAGIPNSKFIVFNKSSLSKIDFEEVKNYLGLPLFVKPANLGSSVGINKVNDERQFVDAIMEAFEYDNKILIEEFIKGREIECAVLGNEEPIASVPGEVIAQKDFYSYKAKYIDDNEALLKAPADLPKHLILKVQQLAVEVFKTLSCEGMARVDFFLKENEELYVNEINTIPGFTKISMYPKLWELSGIPYSDLIDKLIQFALERYNREMKLKTSF